MGTMLLRQRQIRAIATMGRSYEHSRVRFPDLGTARGKRPGRAGPDPAHDRVPAYITSISLSANSLHLTSIAPSIRRAKS